MATHSSILPGEFQVDYSPQGWKDLDMTEWQTLVSEKLKQKRILLFLSPHPLPALCL